MARIFIRGFIYLLLAVLVAEVLRWEALTLEPTRQFSEFGYTEWMQSLVLLCMVVLLWLNARRQKQFSQLSICMMAVFGFLLIRENDQILELFLPHGAWKYPAGLVALGGAWYFWKHRLEVARELIVYQQTASFGVMLSGFVLLVFSRMFGRGEFWKAVMGPEYSRVVKAVAEEGVELMALTLMLVAVIELVMLRPGKNQSD